MPAGAPLKRVIGIDPGALGGLGVLDVDGEGAVLGVELVKTPRVTVTRNARERLDYDPAAMRELLARTVDGRDPTIRVVEVALEAQGARPGQGTASSYRIGVGYGLWLGLVVGMRVPYRVVLPAVWKRHADLIGKDKRVSRLRAQERFPALGAVRAANEGPAEALLLAAYVAAQTKGPAHAS